MGDHEGNQRRLFEIDELTKFNSTRPDLLRIATDGTSATLRPL
jgi:hypothetical protein